MRYEAWSDPFATRLILEVDFDDPSLRVFSYLKPSTSTMRYLPNHVLPFLPFPFDRRLILQNGYKSGIIEV